VRADPFSARDELLASPAPPAHLCATAWVLDASRRRTLLCRHRTLGWSVPGGHLELGEAPQDGALRELREETGLLGRLLVPDPCFVHRSAVDGARPHRHWNVAYAVEADTTGPLVVERDEVCWFDLDDLPAEHPPDLEPGLIAVVELLDTLM
jgi:ADP-ribose pyrophosphatase YjhB (NUDIX family)